MENLCYALWNSQDGVETVHIGTRKEAEIIMHDLEVNFKKTFPHSAEIVYYLAYEVPFTMGEKTTVPKFECKSCGVNKG